VVCRAFSDFVAARCCRMVGGLFSDFAVARGRKMVVGGVFSDLWLPGAGKL